MLSSDKRSPTLLVIICTLHSEKFLQCRTNVLIDRQKHFLAWLSFSFLTLNERLLLSY
jgi:hypothetical protein